MPLRTYTNFRLCSSASNTTDYVNSALKLRTIYGTSTYQNYSNIAYIPIGSDVAASVKAALEGQVVVNYTGNNPNKPASTTFHWGNSAFQMGE